MAHQGTCPGVGRALSYDLRRRPAGLFVFRGGSRPRKRLPLLTSLTESPGLARCLPGGFSCAVSVVGQKTRLYLWGPRVRHSGLATTAWWPRSPVLAGSFSVSPGGSVVSWGVFCAPVAVGGEQSRLVLWGPFSRYLGVAPLEEAAAVPTCRTPPFPSPGGQRCSLGIFSRAVSVRGEQFRFH